MLAVIVFLQSAQTGGGVPGCNWEEKEGGFGNSLCPPFAEHHTTGEERRRGLPVGEGKTGWLDIRAGGRLC